MLNCECRFLSLDIDSYLILLLLLSCRIPLWVRHLSFEIVCLHCVTEYRYSINYLLLSVFPLNDCLLEFMEVELFFVNIFSMLQSVYVNLFVFIIYGK